MAEAKIEYLEDSLLTLHSLWQQRLAGKRMEEKLCIAEVKHASNRFTFLLHKHKVCVIQIEWKVGRDLVPQVNHILHQPHPR